ncbi:MAG: hypothetical protein ACK5NT_04650, partial [Pyrinomonadaceae bacterium]
SIFDDIQRGKFQKRVLRVDEIEDTREKSVFSRLTSFLRVEKKPSVAGEDLDEGFESETLAESEGGR